MVLPLTRSPRKHLFTIQTDLVLILNFTYEKVMDVAQNNSRVDIQSSKNIIQQNDLSMGIDSPCKSDACL